MAKSKGQGSTDLWYFDSGFAAQVPVTPGLCSARPFYGGTEYLSALTAGKSFVLLTSSKLPCCRGLGMFDARRLIAGLIMPQEHQKYSNGVGSSLYANARNKSRLTAGFCIGSASSYHLVFSTQKVAWLLCGHTKPSTDSYKPVRLQPTTKVCTRWPLQQAPLRQ